MRPRVVRGRDLEAPAEQVWAVLGDLSRHDELIPATRVDAPARTTRPGDRVTAVSAGLLVDRMETVSVRETPPGAPWGRWATLRKVGPVLFGVAHLAVLARGERGCTALWAEDVTLRGARWAPVDAALDGGFAVMADLALARLATLVGPPSAAR